MAALGDPETWGLKWPKHPRHQCVTVSQALPNFGAG